MARVVAVALLASTFIALTPAPAAAHAFLVRSVPSAGARLARAPRRIRLVFDEPVRPAPGIAVIRNGGGSVLAGRPYVPRGAATEIVVPLRAHLADGDYTVRWREIDVDDGHLISGVFAFAVGPGSPPPHTALSAGGTGPPFSALASRWLRLVGLLAAAGSAGFAVLVWRPVLGLADWERRRRATGAVLAVSLAVAALGALLSVVLQPGTSATRFGRWTEIGAAVAAAAATAAVGSLRLRRLLPPAGGAAVALLALPACTGHALAPGPPHAVSVPADLVHLAAAAFWIGGGLELAVVAPLVLRPFGAERRGPAYARLVRRYSRYAIVAVAVLGASGIVRAVTELSSASQIVTTGYGRTLLVKTGLLAGLLVLGWANRYRLTPALADETGAATLLRRSVGVELGLLVVVVGAVAVLTNVRPGRDYPAAAAASPPSPAQTVVLAGQDDDLAIGLALTPRGASSVLLRATVLGLDGPVGGLGLSFVVSSGGGAHTAAATPCGTGCYQATAAIDGRPRLVLLHVQRRAHPPATLRFAPSARWPAPPAAAIVRRAAQTIRHLKTLVEHSRLASDSRHEVTTNYQIAAPDRLAYQNVGGSQTVIIGGRRWDRQPGGRWVEAPQDPPIRQPVPFWPPRFTDAHLLGEGRVDGRPVWKVSFLDPTTPAWFTIWVDRATYRTLRLEMIATAHFMHNREGPFDAPIEIVPPTHG